MTEAYKMTIICETCSGTGLVPLGAQGTDIECSACSGDGRLSMGTIEGAEQIADLTDKVDDCLGKLNDIIEKLNE